MQPDAALEQAFEQRGTGQWTYGEVSLANNGCSNLVDALLDGASPAECTLLDVGSGVGQVVLYAAAVARVHHAIGIELVPSRHAVAEAARSAMIDAGFDHVRHATRFRCADALHESEHAHVSQATHVFMANVTLLPPCFPHRGAHVMSMRC